jgi:hypothetical protein
MVCGVGAAVTGTVTVSGKQLADVTVCANAPPSACASTDTKGQYVLTGAMPGVALNVCADPVNVQPRTAQVCENVAAVSAGATAKLNFAL